MLQKLKFAVIGNPINHSLSPYIHQHFAQQFNINLSYEKISVDINNDDFENYVKNFFLNGGSGLNITLPFKLRAYKLLANTAKLSAVYAKAANTLFSINNEIHADNTDGIGLVKDILNKGYKIENANILLLGAGGAAAGILYYLAQQKPARICIANRNFDNARNLVSASLVYAKNIIMTSIPLASLYANNTLFDANFSLVKFDIIINATSLGMNEDSVHAEFYVSSDFYHSQTLAYDMIYNNSSLFANWALKVKLPLFDGLGMLIEQAASAFEIWHNLVPDTKFLHQNLHKQIQHKNYI